MTIYAGSDNVVNRPLSIRSGGGAGATSGIGGIAPINVTGAGERGDVGDAVGAGGPVDHAKRGRDACGDGLAKDHRDAPLTVGE